MHYGAEVTESSTNKQHHLSKKCIQVGRETYAVTSQPGTSYTFETRIDTGTFQGQRLQPVTTPVCDDYDSILVIDSSEPRMQPTRTTNKRKTNRTKHDRRANVQTSARPSESYHRPHLQAKFLIKSWVALFRPSQNASRFLGLLVP